MEDRECVNNEGWRDTENLNVNNSDNKCLI